MTTIKLEVTEDVTDELVAETGGARGADAAREFQQWLDARLGEVPRAPVLPPEAFDRSTIYDD